MRNFAGSHRLATGFKAAGPNCTGPIAASFTFWRFGEAVCFAAATGLCDAACLTGLPCFDDFSLLWSP